MLQRVAMFVFWKLPHVTPSSYHKWYLSYATWEAAFGYLYII